MPYICRNPEAYEGHYKGESHECVAFVEFVANAPQTARWRPGAAVLGNADIERGTAIACGWLDGLYPSHKHGNHARFTSDSTPGSSRCGTKVTPRAPSGGAIRPPAPTIRTTSSSKSASPEHTTRSSDPDDHHRVIRWIALSRTPFGPSRVPVLTRIPLRLCPQRRSGVASGFGGLERRISRLRERAEVFRETPANARPLIAPSD